MKIVSSIILAALVLTGCSNREEEADGYGNFEATEVILSAETNGRILEYESAEGSLVKKGGRIALIDTTLLSLQKAEINAGINSVRTKVSSIIAQNEILDQQIANLDINIKRIENMLKDDAATRKQYDDLTGQAAVLRKQIAANNTQRASIAAEIAVLETRKASINEQIMRCSLKSPLDGTMIEKYSEEGEITAAGKPLAKIADLSLMKLRVYISGAQLSGVRMGQECTVRIDEGEKGYRSFPATVTYISEKAEFTPKIIQTKEERVTLVYAVILDVVNDGSIKSGMPGEAVFSEPNLK